jgi:hypothetical protein
MSNIISAIHDDMNEYEELCREYRETPIKTPDRWGNMLVDCYGTHARDLKKRARLEYEQERERSEYERKA